MKQSQISVEFIALFTVILFMLAILIAFLPGMLDKTSEAKNLPEKVARDIKARAITASLSESDFESNITLSSKISGVSIEVEAVADPDNIIMIRDARTKRVLAKAFLPVIDSVSGSGLTVTIKKDTSSNEMSIELS